jgi:opacity protein-like surface antigen
MRTLKITFFFLVLLCFTVTGVSFSQVKTKSSKLKPPKLTVELNSSYNLPLQETKGDVADFFQFKNYGTKIGFGGHLNFKLAVDRKKGSMRPYLTLGYAQFQNDDVNYAYIDSNNITGGYPLTTGQYGKVAGSCDLFLRSATAGLGFEYAFTKADKNGRFIPFMGLDLNLNVMWGLYKQTPTQTFPGQLNPNTEISYTIKSTVRFGFGVGGGFQYRVSEPFGLNLGFKYKWDNVIGKKSERTKSASQDPNDENKMELLDKGDTSINSLLSKDRNFGYISIYFGFAFYVGRVK